MTSIVPTQSNAQAMMKSFLASVLPSEVTIVTAQQNRVAEPRSPSFVVMTPIRFERLRTNVERWEDATFDGVISGTTLSVDALVGTIGVGSVLFGSGVLLGTSIVATGASPGEWLVSPAQVTAGRMAAGRKSWEQGAMLTMQLDVHSADTSIAGDLAQIITTMFRSSYAVDQFRAQSPSYDITPLYADDARQTPFVNEAQQFEWRWTVEARLQVNDVVSLPMQFADSLAVDVVSVDATFPP